MNRFANVTDLEKHRESLVAAFDPDRTRITVCGGTGCNAQGSIKLVDALRAAVATHGLADSVEVKVTGCHGFCEKGPVVVIRPANTFYVQVKAEDADELIRVTLKENGVVDRLLYTDPSSGRKVVREQEVPFYAKQTRSHPGRERPPGPEVDRRLHPARRLLRPRQGARLDDARRRHRRGQEGRPARAGRRRLPHRGQVGAVPQSGRRREVHHLQRRRGRPGAYMNRSELEGNPHLILEGMLLGAYAIGARHAYIYCRAEYPLAIEQLNRGIAQAKECGLIGENILGSGFSLDFVIKQGAGAFVCGEETALMHSIEGKRGMPTPRPPFPAQSGVFGKPSNINNVETWANVPLIINRGADWFAGIGSEKSKGTKVFSLVGCVNNTGLVEVPFGTSLRTIVEDIGGGTPRGSKFKAAQMGGPSGGCIPAAHIDTPLDYESLQALGAIVGSGGLVVMDDTTCMVDLAKYFMEFIQSESCGKCIPCREGTRRMKEILDALTRSRRKEHDLDPLVRMQGLMQLKQLAETIRTTALCGLGQTAPNPVLSTLRYFRDEYEAHLYDRHCPAGSCKELVGAPCQNSCPAGTEVWRYVAHIGRGEYADAYRVIREANPFPSACARVCHHPCERSCRAGASGAGEPVAIRSLKRFVVDRVPADTYRPVARRPGTNSARIAVVGAGPAGLTAAHHLSLLGHRVTVFEREAVPGGMLVGAIPAYRLPRERLASEIESLLNDNLDIRYEKTLGRDFTVDSLMAEGYKAVYLAIGSHQSKTLDLPGEDARRDPPGISFLKAYNLHGENLAKGRVGIIGGGNSAMDAARVALRQPGVESVTMFYRRTRDEMPAYAEEIEAGLAEGVDDRAARRPGGGPLRRRRARRRPFRPQPSLRAGRVRTSQASVHPGLRVRRPARHADRRDQRGARDRPARGPDHHEVGHALGQPRVAHHQPSRRVRGRRRDDGPEHGDRRHRRGEAGGDDDRPLRHRQAPEGAAQGQAADRLHRPRRGPRGRGVRAPRGAGCDAAPAGRRQKIEL